MSNCNRDPSDLTGMGKTTIPSQYRAIKESINGPLYTDEGLVAENTTVWVFKNFTNALKYRRCSIPKPEPDYNGIFTIENDEEPVVIGLLSDWATATCDAEKIAGQMGSHDPQYTIHLGDTYYVGNEVEINANFCPDNGGTWPYGSIGSFAMIGNHEMYSTGYAYFNTLLPMMGIFSGKEVINKQQTSYFCLENKYWRIIALDTGYDSLSLKVLPDKNLHLSKKQRQWLQNEVQISNDKRGIIILSHHQCRSAFEDEFENPLTFISDEMNPFPRNILWLCGHEHRFSVYGPNPMDNGANVYVRCIGNSGMPVEIDKNHVPIKPKEADPGAYENRNLVLYDQRCRNILLDKDNIRLGHNGYVLMTLTGPNLQLLYYDDGNFSAGQGRPILEESWTCDINAGTITGNNITDYTLNFSTDPAERLTKCGDDVRDAIW